MTNNKNVEILQAMISTCLHSTAERKAMTHKEIMTTAAELRKALRPLYSVTDKEWESVLRDIAKYADCLI